MANDFRKKEINTKTKMKEITATITKKQNLLRQQERRLNATLIKYSSFLGVKNVWSASKFGVKIMEIKIAEINATLNQRRGRN